MSAESVGEWLPSTDGGRNNRSTSWWKQLLAPGPGHRGIKPTQGQKEPKDHLVLRENTKLGDNYLWNSHRVDLRVGSVDTMTSPIGWIPLKCDINWKAIYLFLPGEKQRLQNRLKAKYAFQQKWIATSSESEQCCGRSCPSKRPHP